MARWDVVQAYHVCQAVAEYDSLGQDKFLARYGFGRARAHVLVVAGKNYDSKAVLGGAYKRATGRRLKPSDFGSGAGGAAGVLRRLGFDVRDIRDAEAW